MIEKILGKKRKLKREAKALRSSMSQGLHWLSDHGIIVNTVLDVGASNGKWSKECMAFFPSAGYVLFEPHPVHHEALEVFAASCEQTVITVKKAAGAKEEKGLLKFDREDPYSGIITDQESENTIKVDVVPIDISLSELPVEGPYLLKLDTHGIERSILQGAARTLEDTKILIIEAYNYRITDEAFLFWELCAHLHEKGFRAIDLVDVTHRDYDGSLWQMDIIFIRSTWPGFQHISYK